MTTIRIRPKALEYDAVLYDGTNADEIGEFCNAKITAPDSDFIYVVAEGVPAFWVHPGSLVVDKGEHTTPGQHRFSTLSAEEFSAKFEEVPTPYLGDSYLIAAEHLWALIYAIPGADELLPALEARYGRPTPVPKALDPGDDIVCAACGNPPEMHGPNREHPPVAPWLLDLRAKTAEDALPWHEGRRHATNDGLTTLCGITIPRGAERAPDGEPWCLACQDRDV